MSEKLFLLVFYKGLSARDITDTLQEMYGMEVSAATISHITDKILPALEAWQSRPLALECLQPHLLP